MNNVKNKKILYLCIVLFGILGIYLTFIASNTNKYDSQVRAYRIYPNESYDSDDETIYQPIYYFKVNGIEYECETKTGSSSYPKENKNMVYYDSTDPTKCKTEYEKSTSKIAGIICLITTSLMLYFFIIKKPSNNIEDFNKLNEEKEYQFEQKKVQKIVGIVSHVQLIYRRVLLGIAIVILFVFLLIDTIIFIQTIKARNYVETKATYADKKDDVDSEFFVDYIYVFVDKEGRRHKIVERFFKENSIEPKLEILVKYNVNNPQDNYTEESLLDKSEMIWYIVKIGIFILLIILFSNKKILNKINI